ncbi:MAG: hypothetical protein ACLRFK_04165 [Alphaproteobacteria bacterium]
MPKQTTKKPATKKTVAKKPAVKPAAKKTISKKAAAPVVEHAHCCCEHKCGCKCHRGKGLKKLIAVILVFALGFATAKVCDTHKMHKKMPRPEFDNGCLVVKCPKMANMVSKLDANKDGCVSVKEFRATEKHMRRPGQKVQRATPKVQRATPKIQRATQKVQRATPKVQRPAPKIQRVTPKMQQPTPTEPVVSE